jgi:MoxR-like ATPase
MQTLIKLVNADLKFSAMIWGPPGVGKSSVVAQVAAEQQLAIIDIRLNQLTPMDFRGVPVPENGITRWFPPEFLPRDGKGILFLDELNMAVPVMQGLAQQLILDRKLGSYVVPEGWFIWAAGNRKEDKATVFDMPAPLANRFVHLEVTPDLDSFKHYAFDQGLDETIIAFLGFRPALLHAFDEKEHTWPSPRSWEMASQLLTAGLPIDMAVGKQVATEFKMFARLSKEVPDIKKILTGKSEEPFPDNPSIAYATITALSARAAKAVELYNAAVWLADKNKSEWFQAFALDAFAIAKKRRIFSSFSKLVGQDKRMLKFLANYMELINYEDV